MAEWHGWPAQNHTRNTNYMRFTLLSGRMAATARLARLADRLSACLERPSPMHMPHEFESLSSQPIEAVSITNLQK